MKDGRGVYYYPNPQNKRVRMYVRQLGKTIEFRLWNQDDEGLWDEHGWVPYEAVLQASDMFGKRRFKPRQTYDIEIARALLKENR